MKKLFACCLLFACLPGFSQDHVMTVPLNQFAEDDRFEKFMITMPLFLLDNDTVLSLDFENLHPAKPVRVVKPQGYGYYAYGYIFFPGLPNPQNPGYVNVLVGNVYNTAPHLYIDRNNNYDFTDDGPRLVLPAPGDSVEFDLNRAGSPTSAIRIRLKRLQFNNQPGYRKLMNDYYAYFYKDRKFAGIENSYREQRFITRAGTVRYDRDSFRIALYDGNVNGLYNEPDSDKIITAHFADRIFDSRDDLRAFTIVGGKKPMYVENQGEQFEVIEIDPAGQFIRLKILREQLLLGRIPPGRKIPRFGFTTWQGEKKKIRKFRKHQVFMYFTGPNAGNFTQDTALLRAIAELDPAHLRVIGFIDVNKSYELKIFGTYSNLNWVAAYKDKDINRKLSVRGLPSSIWLKKRRRVAAYNLTPAAFLENYHRQQASGK